MRDCDNNHALNEALAREVMGWELSPDGVYWLAPRDEEGYTKMILVREWRPTSCWRDLGCVIEKAAETGMAYVFNLRNSLFGDWSAMTRLRGGPEFTEYGQTPTKALAQAVLTAARAKRESG